MAKAQEEFLLEIPLTDGGGTLRFRSLEEIEAWLRSEQAAFQFLRQTATQEGTISVLWNRVAQLANQVQQQVSQARIGAASSAVSSSSLNQIKQAASDFYTWSGLGSASPRRAFVLDLAKRNPMAAAFAFAYLVNQQPVNLTKPAALEGIIEAFLFSKNALPPGGQAASDANFKALDDLRANFSSALDEHRRNAETYKSQLKGLVDTSGAWLAEQAGELKKLRDTHEKGFYIELQAGKQQLQDIAAAYDAKMALQAPVTYWESQRNKHRWTAIGFSIASVLWAVASVGFIYYAAEQLLSAAPNETILIAGIPLPKVPLWHFALLVVLLTFAFWFERIFVRLLLSQVHLYTDASERVVMAKTYIALLREGQGMKDEDRRLILQALFRPAVTGIVKDDAIPPTVLEWITRLGSK
jgi:hypothetical protein